MGRFSPFGDERQQAAWKRASTAAAMKERDRWKPVRRGHIYCAPACGGNCTWQAYQAACKRGEALAKTLGPGFRWRVFENLGWHYEAIRGAVRVLPFAYRGKVGSYTAYSGPFCESARTPQATVRRIVAAIHDEIASLQKRVRTIEGR